VLTLGSYCGETIIILTTAEIEGKQEQEQEQEKKPVSPSLS
jgi:hypothetical protein